MKGMNNQLPLILAVADLAYSGGEVFDLLSSRLDKYGVRANVQTAPLADIVETIRRLQPDLIVIGHRPLLEDQAMRERWEAAGSPMGGDIIKALKSSVETRDIPVLLLEGLHDIERAAEEFGADAYLQTPTGPIEFTDAIRALIERSTGDSNQREPAC
jgi:CheY-like chemotaxis protein